MSLTNGTTQRDIIVIGASAGGITALTALVQNLPADLKAAVFIVLHVSPYTPSMLPQILERSCQLKVQQAEDGNHIRYGHIYVAPPDHHLLLEDGRIAVKKGPKENRFRPSIDALFRSAAYVYGPRVIGIVLSGLLDDGTSGMWSVKRMGGVGIIQDPNEAQWPNMPTNVLEYVEVDHILPTAEIGSFVVDLLQENESGKVLVSEAEKKRMELEIHIASHDNAFNMGVMNIGELSPLACPECSGVLTQLQEGSLIRYRCHTGHSYTQSALLASITKDIEDSMWKAVRGMEEAVMLLESSAQQMHNMGHHDKAAGFLNEAEDIRHKADEIRKHVFDQKKMSADSF